MRRWHLCLALSFLSSVVSVPAADAALSADKTAGAIVSGLLTDTADKPVAGGVELFAWPTGRPAEVGQTVQLLPVGHDRAAEDGHFSVTGDLTPELAELARLNGGYINFVLQASSVGTFEETHVSRYVGDVPFTAQQVGSGNRPTKWRASPEEPAEPVRVRLTHEPGPTTTSGDRRISPMQGGCTGLKLIETQIRPTVIGELRAPDDTVTAEFVYGKRADSEIGIAGRASNGRWGLTGSFHIANSGTGAISQGAKSGEHRLVRARFKYDRYEHTCPSGRREKVVVREWMGDAKAEPTAVRGCAHAPEDHRGYYGPDSGFNRVKEKAVTWSGAVEVFGASLTARSGYSQFVRSDWRFGPAGDHPLCGDDGSPLDAGHIFAGPSA